MKPRGFIRPCLFFQLQQTAPSKRGARTETSSSATDCWERENSKMAVHSTMRGVGFGDQKTSSRGKIR
jgi:hypothetical protein